MFISVLSVKCKHVNSINVHMQENKFNKFNNKFNKVCTLDK